MLAALSRLKIYKTLNWDVKGVLLEMLCALDKLKGGFYADKEMKVPLSDAQISRLIGVMELQWVNFKQTLIEGGVLRERNGGVYCPLLTESVEVKADPDDLALADSILEFWNSKNIQKHGRTSVLIAKIIRFVKKFAYTKEQLEDAITNYERILHSSDYFWTKKWSITDFLSRGVDRFVSDARPFEMFQQQSSMKKKQSILTPKPRKEIDLKDLE